MIARNGEISVTYGANKLLFILRARRNLQRIDKSNNNFITYI